MVLTVVRLSLLCVAAANAGRELPKAPAMMAAASQPYDAVFKKFKQEGIIDTSLHMKESEESKLETLKQTNVVSATQRMEADMAKVAMHVGIMDRHASDLGGNTKQHHRHSSSFLAESAAAIPKAALPKAPPMMAAASASYDSVFHAFKQNGVFTSAEQSGESEESKLESLKQRNVVSATQRMEADMARVAQHVKVMNNHADDVSDHTRKHHNHAGAFLAESKGDGDLSFGEEWLSLEANAAPNKQTL